MLCVFCHTALRPTQPPIQWVPGALSPGIKRQGLEADHSSPTNAEVKNSGALPPLPIYLHGVVLNWLSTGANLLYFLPLWASVLKGLNSEIIISLICYAIVVIWIDDPIGWEADSDYTDEVHNKPCDHWVYSTLSNDVAFYYSMWLRLSSVVYSPRPSFNAICFMIEAWLVKIG
jgi:hypothetical protein